MPVIHGRYYMNPAMGAAVERARAAKETAEPEDGEPQGNSESERDGHGRFVAPGAVHHVEVEVADGGYLARLHRHPHSGSQSEPLHAGLPPRPSSHVFTDHHDLVEFLRNELGKNR